MGLVSVELDKGIEHLAVNKPFLLKGLESLSEFLDDAALPLFVVVVCTAAEEIVSEPEHGSEDRGISEVFIVNLLKRNHRVVSLDTVDIKVFEFFDFVRLLCMKSLSLSSTARARSNVTFLKVVIEVTKISL